MTIKKETLEKICLELLQEKNLRNFQDFDLEVVPYENMDVHLAAWMTLEDWRMHFMVAEELDTFLGEVRKRKQIDLSQEEALRKMLRFDMLHEYGHYRYCSASPEGEQRLIDGILPVVKRYRFREDDIVADVASLKNKFADTVLNVVQAHGEDGFADGFCIDYLTGLLARGGRMSKGGALFMESNLLLGYMSLQKKFRGYFPRFFPAHSRRIRQLVDIFTGDKEATQAVLQQKEPEAVSSLLQQRLLNPYLWTEMAARYTEVMLPYQDADEPESCAHDHPPMPLPGMGSGGPKKKGKPQKGKGKDKNKKPGRRGKGKNDNNFDGLPGIFPRQLHRLYGERAGRIALFAEDEQDPLRFEKYQGQEQADGDEQKPYLWSATKIYPAGTAETAKNFPAGETTGRRIQLVQGSFPIDLEIAALQAPGHIPDLAWILDCSASMSFDPWKGEGEYHIASLAVYSKLRYLEEIGIAPLLNYNLTGFSDETLSSGWRSYYELPEVIKSLFAYQGGGTTLDPKLIRNLWQKRRDNFICFMLSDTDFNSRANAEEVLREIDTMLEIPGIGFFLFQIGAESSFSTELRKRGKAGVLPVTGAQDFLNLGLRFTRDLYGEAVHA